MMEVEAVNHALCWIASRGDNRTTHAIILKDSMSLLQKVKSGMGNPDWNVSMVDIHIRKLLWVYCPGHTGVKGRLRWSSLKGWELLSIRWSLKLFQRWHWENFWEMGWSEHGLFWAHRYHLWTELNWAISSKRKQDKTVSFSCQQCGETSSSRKQTPCTRLNLIHTNSSYRFMASTVQCSPFITNSLIMNFIRYGQNAHIFLAKHVLSLCKHPWNVKKKLIDIYIQFFPYLQFPFQDSHLL